ncbi:TetR/AcrR family transcriptional regulator [Cupriavidus necator]|uniref:Regulatory protein, TetR n=1 Tax=Cupriavidus pinatubonensis (strain JMP 134 / LMG 1197) TaxID=264198 RepID=Q46UD0_CUPPJ|nr:helix-turn-helix domain-containing protein [Cupriavidus necator]
MPRIRTLSSLVAEASHPAGRPPPAEAAAPAAAQQSETAMRMLEIAERLFAEHGIEQVPLRQIVVEAGQRNRSALHYHFGSREALVAHLLNLRLAHVNVLRNAYLDEVEAAGKAGDVRAIVHASISALADTVVDTAWGGNYLQVAAQTMFSPTLFNAELLDKDAMTGLVRTRRMVMAALPDVPAKVMDYRLMWFNHGTVFSLADWYQRTRAEHGAPPVDELADYCTAGLTGPVTRTTSAPRRAGKARKG